MLDNECPGGLKTFLREASVKLQLVPSYLYCANAAEQAIQTYKDHLISGLSSCDPNFSLHIWYRLITHATLTLNLLRPSRLNPRLSAEAQLNGDFDFNCTPLALPGTRVIVHETPKNRRTWSPHGVDGCYLGPAPDHYLCHRVYIPRTCAERISKTVEFFPHDCPVPAGSSKSAAIAAARALAEALLHPTPTPFAKLGEDQFSDIQTLSRIFSNVSENPPTENTPKTPQPAPAGALKKDCPAPSSRVPTLTPSALSPRVTMVPPTLTPNNNPPKLVPITPVRCIRWPTPTPTPEIIEPDRDDQVLKSQYHLQS